MQGDKFAGGFHADEWPRNGIILKPSAKTTSENYLHALPMLVVGTCPLLDNARLRTQLAALERYAQPVAATRSRMHTSPPRTMT
jgi:hypothetical protein